MSDLPSDHDEGAQVIPLNAGRRGETPEGSPLEDKIASGLAFLRRRLAGEYEIDEFGFDPEFNATVVLPIARALYDHWFRVEMHGLEHVPDKGSALIVTNHSGTLPL
ncbi:MAG: glycerol acyltransferase, partial [Actinomadura sp.]